MKRNKKIYILLGILAVACIATAIVKGIEDKKEDIQTTGETILAVSPDDVNALSWEYDNNSFSFHKNESWQWDDDEEFPVDSDKINDLLSNFENLAATFKIENVEDLSQYGLDKPTCTIDFSTSDQDYEVILGNFSSMDSQRYLSIGDGNVYLVSVDPFDSFNIEISDVIENDTAPSFDNISKMEFSGLDDYSLEYVADSTDSYCEDDVYFAKVDGETLPLDTDNVENYCYSISSLDLSNYVTYNVTDNELSNWGLDNPQFKVTVNYTENDKDDSETFVLSIGQNQEELKKKQETEAKGDEYDDTVTAYVRINDSKIIYKITDDEYQALIAGTHDDLRHKDVMTADMNTITQIDITLDGSTYSLTEGKVEDEDEGTYTYSFNGEDVEAKTLHNKISALTINSFMDQTPSEKKEIGFVFYLDNEDHPQMSVDLYRYDGDNCLVVINGESVGLVSRSEVVNVIEAVNSIVL